MPDPALLLILDGFGLAGDGPGNAVAQARTPNLDALFAAHPTARLACSGLEVGLPAGFMGNSEVGHMNLGAGRTVWQDLTRIDLAVESGEYVDNPVLNDLLARIKARGGALHIFGLLSDAGVHSRMRHLFSTVFAAQRAGVQVFVHAFLDGRDSPPTSGIGFVRDLELALRHLRHGALASVMGRFWGMDRDKRWDRTERAWKTLVQGEGDPWSSATEAVEKAYDAGITDEFIEPKLIVGNFGAPFHPVSDNDGVFFFNFRADRARQLLAAFVADDFSGFDRPLRPELAGIATMTRFDASLDVPAAFPPQSLADGLGELVSRAGLSQLRIAETEKYAHVTYFFNGGREEPWLGEERFLVPSPRDVPTYDLKPEMSAEPVTDALVERIERRAFDLYVCNLANCDMVGHTGDLAAAIKAVEAVDACVGRIAKACAASQTRFLLVADHGNAECMLDPEGRVHTAHTTNPVPCLVAAGRPLARTLGALKDVAPTILDLLGLPKPDVMDGTSLFTEPQGAA